jgi:hypothetical protein
LFWLYCLAASAQYLYDSTKLSPLVQRTAYRVDTCTNHYRGDKSEYIFRNFKEYGGLLKLLKSRAKQSELEQLVNHPNPFIRVHAFDYLLDLGYPKFIDILEQHLHDTDRVYFGYSHQLSEASVIEVMLERLAGNNNWVGKVHVSEADNKRLAALEDRYWRSKKKPS